MKITHDASPALSEIWEAVKKFPEARWDEAFSKGQVASKLWLAKTLEEVFQGRRFECVFLLAGWYGLLARILLDETEKVTFAKIRSFDIDPACEAVADTLNRKWVMKDWTFKASTQDIMDIDYSGHRYRVKNSKGQVAELYETPDLILNTSCEHLTDFDGWLAKIPADVPVVLQSNDYFEAPEHKNCVKSLEDFLKQASLKKVLFADAMKFPEYQRFMIIGTR
jgi:hypothetical protein